MRMYIYGLYGRYQGSSGCIRYIGMTKDPEKRMRAHINNMYRPDMECQRKNKWFRSLRSLNRIPRMRVLLIVESLVVHDDGESCCEARFMETLIKEAAIYEFGPEQILNAKYWRHIK